MEAVGPDRESGVSTQGRPLGRPSEYLTMPRKRHTLTWIMDPEPNSVSRLINALTNGHTSAIAADRTGDVIRVRQTISGRYQIGHVNGCPKPRTHTRLSAYLETYATIDEAMAVAESLFA